METSRRFTKRIATMFILAAAVLVALVPAPATGGAAPTAEASASSTVDIRNFAFHPGTLSIAKGSKVIFSNSSGVAHTATRAGAFDTGRIKPGKSVSVRFTQKGTFPYHCKIHRFMHGKIVVD
jgi:plastocyanin